MNYPGIQFTGVLVRFILGGGAVSAAYIFSRRLGGKWGGIFAAFPAVYIASITTVALGIPALRSVPLTLDVSRGALVGMLSNILCAMAAYLAIRRLGWKQGLVVALSIWLICVSTVYLVVAELGMVR